MLGRIAHEGFDGHSQPSHHRQHTVDFHPSALLCAGNCRLAHTNLGGDLLPRETTLDALLVERAKERARVKTRDQEVEDLRTRAPTSEFFKDFLGLLGVVTHDRELDETIRHAGDVHRFQVDTRLAKSLADIG